MITLEDLLLSRDRRTQRQRSLLGRYPGSCLLCLTVIPPGMEKRTPVSLEIAAAGVQAVRESFNIIYEDLRDLETGYEGYFTVAGEPFELKRSAVLLEESHPLGRLWDLDVIVPSGAAVRPLSRDEIGLGERPCLLCGKPVRLCMRLRSHTPEELISRMEEMVSDYERNKDGILGQAY